MNKYALRRTPLAVTIGSLLAGGGVQAATITVTTAADGGIGYIDGCSLREAIVSANGSFIEGCVTGSAGAADEIVFDESLAHSTITLSAGQMEITSPLTITGPVQGDAAGLVIHGNFQSRIFLALGGSTSEFEVGLDSLTLTGGYASGYYSAGGAIYAVNVDLSLAHIVITGNSVNAVYFAFGGGLWLKHGLATLIHSTVSGNSANANYGAHGGGLSFDYSSVNLRYSTISGNGAKASSNNSYATGGGLFLSNGTVVLRNSTVSGNLARSTILGFSPRARGGGLFVDGFAGLTHSTVAFNSVYANSTCCTGVYASIMFMNNSLIVESQNTSACNDEADIHTHSLATDASCTGTATDVADIALNPLADNGGLTKTHALDAGSVAIEGAGDCQNEFSVSEDQRGLNRPGIGSLACDIGAFEFQFVPLLAPASVDFGDVRIGTASASQMVQLDNPFAENLELIAVAPAPGPDEAAFAVTQDNCTGATLPGKGSCTVQVEFTPNDPRDFSVELEAMTPIGANSIPMTGTGIPAADEIFDDRFEP